MPDSSVTAAPRWRSDYTVGVEIIDKEHQQLFALAESLHIAIRNGGGTEELRAVLGELVAYTCFHFEHEEKLMADVAYPHLEDHRKEHEDFRRRVQNMASLCTEGGANTPGHVLTCIVQWLRCHTMSSDRRIGTYMRRHGIVA
jgi:hemerythrin